nr:uncharacterized protein BN887_02041 [Melanopsichium pennsylvanicum 4]
MTTTNTRRSTLAAIDPNQNNAHVASALPIPSSAVKSVKTLSGASFQPRASMIPQQSNPIRQVSSTATLREAQHSSQLSGPVHSASHSARRADSATYASRQSVASAGRQSVAVATTPK